MQIRNLKLKCEMSMCRVYNAVNHAPLLVKHAFPLTEFAVAWLGYYICWDDDNCKTGVALPM